MHRKSAYFLFLAVLALLVVGIVMLFSTSAFARDSHGDVSFFIKRQAVWFGIGLAICILAALIDYHFWQRTWWIWFAIALVALAFCFVPHIGMRINGSRRWVGFGQFGFQPSEIAKIAALFFLAWWFTRYEKAGSNPLYNFVLPLAIVGTAAWTDPFRGRSRHHGVARHDGVCGDVRRRSESDFARPGFAHWSGRYSCYCHANIGTHGSSFRVS